jgi:hypothetical protein
MYPRVLAHDVQVTKMFVWNLAADLAAPDNHHSLRHRRYKIKVLLN